MFKILISFVIGIGIGLLINFIDETYGNPLEHYNDNKDNRL